MNPIVSVILPSYNAERTIGTTIKSILQQSLHELELIICDDGSNDRTVEIITEIVDPRIQLIQNKLNLGPGPSRDRAISYAKGRWIAMIDADDSWLPYRLEELIAGIDYQDDVMIFDNLMLFFDSARGIIPWKKLRKKDVFGKQNKKLIDVPVEKYLRLNQYLIKPLIPLHWIHRTGAHHGNFRYWEDNFFFIQLMAAGLRIKYHSDAMYNYRLTPGSLTTNRDRFFQILKILEDLQPMFPQPTPGLEYKTNQIRKQMRYAQILSLLKKREFKKLVPAIASDGWFISMFIHNIRFDLQYKLSGIFHKANLRE